MVMAIMIIVSKVKPTRFLGISYIFTALGCGIGFLSTYCKYNYDHRVINDSIFISYYQPLYWAGVAVSAVALFFVCFFYHKNYGRKLIYIPLFLIPVIQYITNNIVVNMVFAAYKDNVSRDAWYLIVTALIVMIGGIIKASIKIVILFRHRKKEKIIPGAWKTRVIVLSIGTLLYLIYFGYMFAMMDNPDMYDKRAIFVYVYNMAADLNGLLIPGYVLYMVRKAVKPSGDDEALPNVENSVGV